MKVNKSEMYSDKKNIPSVVPQKPPLEQHAPLNGPPAHVNPFDAPHAPSRLGMFVVRHALENDFWLYRS